MIKLGDKEYKLGMNLHVRLMYESITGKIYGERMLEFDWVVLFYCVLLRFNDDFKGTELDRFVDMLSEDDTPFYNFIVWHNEYWERRKMVLSGATGNATEGEKKNQAQLKSIISWCIRVVFLRNMSLTKWKNGKSHLT